MPGVCGVIAYLNALRGIQGTFLVGHGRVICDCETCRGLPEEEREMSATHFESHAGAGTAKKWKSSVRIPAGALPEVPSGAGPTAPSLSGSCITVLQSDISNQLRFIYIF